MIGAVAATTPKLWLIYYREGTKVNTLIFRSAVCLALAIANLGAAENLSLIEKLVAAGKLNEAETALTRAAEETPKDPAVWNLLGAVHAQQGNLAAAQHNFERAVALNPKIVSVWLNLGRVYQLHTANPENLGKSIAAYQTVLKLQPGNPEAHHQLALALHWRGSFADSLTHLDRLPALDQDRRSTLALRCADQAALGNSQEAIVAADKLLAAPGLEESDVSSVLPAIEAHNPDVAKHLLEGLRSKRLAGAEAVAKLASIYERRDNLQAARSAWEQVYRERPSDAEPLLHLGRIAWKQKDYEGTLSYLGHARDLDPKNPAIHFLFGLAANELKLPIEAKESLVKAIELAPENPYYNYAMGVLHLQWREKDGAIPYLAKYVSAHPEDPRGHLALGMAYFSISKTEEAKRELSPLTGDPSVRAGAELLLGRIASQQDDLDAAFSHFRRLVELDPKGADAHAELASIYLRKNESDHAKKETDIALRLDPGNYTANLNRLKLYRADNDPRLKEQSERIKTLLQEQESEAKLLQRTIEVKPF